MKFRFLKFCPLFIFSSWVMASQVLAPYGGELVIRDTDSVSQSVHAIDIDDFTFSDITCIASGIYSPLSGFMTETDYKSVLNNTTLSSGLVWPIPITLAVKDPIFGKNDEVRLRYKGTDVAYLTVSDIYQSSKGEECQAVYGTQDQKHPGVANLLDRPTTYIGGEIKANLSLIKEMSPFNGYLKFPQETRTLFQEMKWQTVTAFQTRNPLHRSHEHLLKVALHLTDGIMLNPLVGYTKNDDIPADVRMETYKVTIDEYFPKNSITLVTYPAAMRYAGPKEAILHAISRQNYGCSHFIVGRDHAGVGTYYHPLAGQQIFSQIHNPNLKIQILKFENAFYCVKTQEMGNSKTCPEDSDTIQLSGTKVREILKSGGTLPQEMTRPKVAEILKQHYTKGE